MQLPSRHLVWLAVAVLTPCVALIVLAVRLIDEEKQFSARRAQEARERSIDTARRTLLAELDFYRADQKPASFRGLLRSGTIVLPWDRPREHPVERARLESAVHNRK